MGRRRTRTGLAGHVINPPEAEAAFNIGKLVVNFSAIEFASYMWIAELSTDDAVLECCVGTPISRRLAIISFLVERARMSKKWKKDVRELWSAVQRLSEDRNVIAHSPVLFVWKGRPAQGPADVIGIPDLRHLRQKHGGKLPIRETLAIRPRIDESARIAQELIDRLEAFRARVDSRRSVQKRPPEDLTGGAA